MQHVSLTKKNIYLYKKSKYRLLYLHKKMFLKKKKKKTCIKYIIYIIM